MIWYKTPYLPQHCWHLWKRPFDLSELVHCDRPHLTFLLVNSYQSNKRLNQYFDFTSKNYFSWSPRKNLSQDRFSEFVLPSVAWRFQRTFYAKTSKMNCAFTSLSGLLFNCPSWIFYMLYYNSRALLGLNNSSKIPCTKPWFFPSKFRKISLFMKVLKIGIFGRFLIEEKIHYLAINLPNTIVTGMPYLPAKDELISLNRLPKGFQNGIIQRF